MIINSEDEHPIPGVNVTIKGDWKGTNTDINGQYKLSVPNNETILVFSCVGFRSEEEVVGNRSVINLDLEPDVIQLKGVVVTAFGIEREKKTVTYAIQNVETEEMIAARPLNYLEGLSGKVAGLSVTKDGTGIGAATKVLLRGHRSIAGSSEPLYVVDGATMGTDIANLSPDDIASISVLKGANATALYGSRANNGVIVVTTKRGRSAKGFHMSLNTSFMASTPILLTEYQNEYGQGYGGDYNAYTNRCWGPKMDGRLVRHWSRDPNWPEDSTDFSAQPDNIKDFYQTGYNLGTNLGISTSSENSDTYFSYTFTNAAGNVPNNELTSHNVNIRYGATILDRLTLDTKLNYIRTTIDNPTGYGGNLAVHTASMMPRNIKTADAKHYEYYDAEGVLKQNYWQADNPYWVINRNLNDGLNERLIGLISLKYDFTENLSLLVRTSLDRSNFSWTKRYYEDTYMSNALRGDYRRKEGRNNEWNTDFLLNYHNQFGSNWSLDASAGGNLRKNFYSDISVYAINGLNVPNLFSFGNMTNVGAGQGYYEKEVQSLYGFATIGWKNAIFLDITGRNDWSSTLPKNNWSYFYPSIGLSVVVTDLLNLGPAWLSYLKVRGSYAKVGNDTDPYRTSRDVSISQGGRHSFLNLSTTIPAENLKPETTISRELGVDLKLFNYRLGLDITAYMTNSTDQLFSVSVPVGSGGSEVFLNAGDIENKGIEAVFSALLLNRINRRLKWDIVFNFGLNRSKVVEIAEGLDTLFLADALTHGQIKLIEGQPWGEVYTKGFERDTLGQVKVDAMGMPKITKGQDIPVANYNPNWLGGIRNTFSYGNFDLSFLIDIRKGGSITSRTNAMLYGEGFTAATLQGRDSTLVFGDNVFSHETAVLEDGTPNNIKVKAETFWIGMGGRDSPVGEAFVSDASNIRLRELVFGYNLPQSVLQGMALTGLRFAFVGRNLFFIYNNSDFDPEVFVTTGNSEGFQSFPPPTMREYGINVKIEF